MPTPDVCSSFPCLSGIALLLAAGELARESERPAAEPAATEAVIAAIPMEAAIAVIPREAWTTPHQAEQPGVPNHPALTSRFFLGAGGYFASTITQARLDSPSGIGTSVNFEELLGLDDRDWSFQGLARWRMSERWRMEAEYFSVDRSNSLALTEDVDWGNQTFPAGSQVDVDFNIAVTRVSFGYSFFKRQDKEVGVALGFHVTDIEADIATSGGSGDDGTVLAPLPVISLYGQFALTDTWALSGRMDAFQLSYDPYQGHLYSIGVDAVWNPWRHVGLGIGWRSLQIDVSADDNDWEGKVETDFQGPIVFLSAYF